jgi:hypothetical protein
LAGIRKVFPVCHSNSVSASRKRTITLRWYQAALLTSNINTSLRLQSDKPHEFPCPNAPNLRPLIQAVCEAVRLALGEGAGAFQLKRDESGDRFRERDLGRLSSTPRCTVPTGLCPKKYGGKNKCFTAT